MNGNLTTVNGGNQTLINDPNLCTLQICDLSLSSLSYIPTLAGNAVYLAIFCVLLMAQLGFGIRFRTWGYTIAIVLGLVLEVLGYSVGRVMMSIQPFINNWFLIYLICVTIAPALITAAIYLCLARIVVVYGTHLSRFKPRTYTLIFCTCDLFSLVLQGLGGGIASTANSTSGKNLGKNIMATGLAFQVFSLILFSICCAEFAWRVRVARGFQGSLNTKFEHVYTSRFFKSFLAGLALAVLTIFIRSVFRCVELSGGFNGKLFNEQIPFMVLEGPMIMIAVGALTILHPGFSFRGSWHEADFQFRESFTWRWVRRNDEGPAFEMKDEPVPSYEESERSLERLSIPYNTVSAVSEDYYTLGTARVAWNPRMVTPPGATVTV